MGVEKLQQNLLTSLFKTITREERKEVLQKEVEEFYNESGNQDGSILPKCRKMPCWSFKKVCCNFTI
jgi:hypothetical protein